MVTSNHILEPASIHVRVDLGGADVGVSEQLLDHAKVRAPDQHVGSEGMTKGMGVNVFEPGDQRILLDDLPYGNPFKGPSAETQEQTMLISSIILVCQLGTNFLQILH